jgi:hypothetical protein
MIREAVVFGLVLFVAINANPIKLDVDKSGDDDTTKLDFGDILTKQIDQKLIDSILTLKRRGGVIAQGDNIDLTQMLKTKIIPNETSKIQKARLMEKFQLLKAKMLENSRQDKMDLLEKQENSENLPSSLPTKPFKVPENIKLPERFAKKLKIATSQKPEEFPKSFASYKGFNEKLKRKISRKMEMM